MKTKNSCYTAFKIVGQFDPDEVSKLLHLTPEFSLKIGDLRHDGVPYDCALWEIGRCDRYDVEVENQMRKTISRLQDKIPLLNRIREENDVEFFLVVVPFVYVDDIAPCLAPSLDVIDFLHATRTKMDIDLYVYHSDDA
ncbi:MAG: DUF4279 domain-containing protein [Clostridia bacterium]|nr:DUF4279 domain-containing protein [Clostridia bacterium]